MKKKIGKAFVWFILAGFSADCAFNKTQWGWNIFRFVEWTMTILYIFAILGKSKQKQKISRSVPAIISLIYDFSLAIALAGFGHFGYASLVIVQQLLKVAFFTES